MFKKLYFHTDVIYFDICLCLKRKSNGKEMSLEFENWKVLLIIYLVHDINLTYNNVLTLEINRKTAKVAILRFCAQHFGYKQYWLRNPKPILNF